MYNHSPGKALVFFKIWRQNPENWHARNANSNFIIKTMILIKLGYYLIVNETSAGTWLLVSKLSLPESSPPRMRLSLRLLNLPLLLVLSKLLPPSEEFERPTHTSFVQVVSPRSGECLEANKLFTIAVAASPVRPPAPTRRGTRCLAPDTHVTRLFPALSPPYAPNTNRRVTPRAIPASRVPVWRSG